MYRLLLLTLLLQLCESYNINSTTNRSKRSRCLNDIIESETTNSLLIISNDTDDLNLRNLHISIQTSTRWNLVKDYPFDLYIIENVNLDRTLRTLRNHSILNTNAKFIIIDTNHSQLNRIFRSLWSFNIVNAIVLHDDVIYTYYPFKYCMNNISYDIVGKCMGVKNLFVNKIPRNLEGCALNMIVIPYTPYVMDYMKDRKDPTVVGIEVTIVDMLAKIMNFTAEYPEDINNMFLNRLYKRDYNSGINLLTEGKAHILFGSAIEDPNMSTKCGYTLFHINDKITWWVPVAQRSPNWKNLKNIFKTNVWFSILTVFIAVSVIWWVIDNKKLVLSNYSKIVFYTYSVLLQLSIQQPKSARVRFIYIIWTCGSILLFTAYQSQLISILTKPFYEHQISNFEELLDSNLTIGTYPTSYTTFNLDMYNDTGRVINCPLNEICLNRTAFQRDLATLKSKKFTDFLITKMYIDENGQPMIVDFKLDTILLFNKFCFKKDFPLIKNISDILLLLHANGLIPQWEKKLQPVVYSKIEESYKQKLTMKHLQSPFYILISMYLCGIIIFLMQSFTTTEFYKEKVARHLNKIKKK